MLAPWSPENVPDWHFLSLTSSLPVLPCPARRGLGNPHSVTSLWAKRPGNFCLQSQVQSRNGEAWKLGGQESLGNPCVGVRTSSASLFSSPPKFGLCFKEEKVACSQVHVLSACFCSWISKALPPCHQERRVGTRSGWTPSGGGCSPAAPFGGSIALGLVRAHQWSSRCLLGVGIFSSPTLSF